MNKRKLNSRNFNSKRPNKGIVLTTDELRNRRQQNKPMRRPQGDLRSRLNGVPTKVVDARTKLTEKRSVEKLNEKTNIAINERRKEQRANIHANNRSLAIDSGSIKITSKFPNRSAKVDGGSLQITAKVEHSKASPKHQHRHHHHKHRNSQINTNGGGLTIKAEQETTPKRNKHDHSGSKLYMDQESSIHAEYERFKAAHQVKQQQKATSPQWKLPPSSITDRLDGPLMEPKRSPQQTSTRITITNLHLTVTRQDIEELFGAVGTLKSCKMLQPGAAEVVYTIKEDAITAYARYHNRNLDGQPMQCKLSSMAVPSGLHSQTTKGSIQATSPPSPKLFHTPAIPYIPSKRPIAPQAQPVIFKVKI